MFFSLFDLGTHNTMDRFIAEAAIKDQSRMVKYIQYFIWYQMITGLIQTTSIAIYAFVWVPRTELAYAVWIMLLTSVTQYPGFLGVFRGALGSLQQFNKVEVLNFISGDVFQRITEIAFVLWGRQWGMQNPQIGEIMGIAIGSVIGLYVDDFFATALSAWYFTKVMKDKGISAKRCFKIEFDWPLVKEAMIFGIKSGMPSIIGLVSGLIQLRIWILYVPQYATFLTLAGIASNISGLINYGMGISLTQLFSESYMNGKRRLTEYYITQYIRFATMVQFFFLSIIAVTLLALPQVFIGIGIGHYLLAIPFIIPQTIRNLQQPLTSLSGSIMLGTNHPTFYVYVQILEESLKVILMWLWIVVLQLPMKYGFTAIIWLMPCGIYPAIITKTVMMFVYIQKKILTLRFNVWQTFIAPTFACIITYVLGYFMKITLFDAVIDRFHIIVTIITIVLIILVLLIFGYFPIHTLLGGWDDDSMREFRKAVAMSGPSKFIVYPMFKIIEFASKKSPLHNRFKMDSSEALKEVQELLEIRKQSIEKAKLENIA